MQTKDWQQIEALFHAAMAMAESERSVYLQQGCAGDDSLRREVESLIKAFESSNGFIDQPVFDLGIKVMCGSQENSLIGTDIGTYKILEKLGKGGMEEAF